MTSQPWAAWPQIRDEAQSSGWRVLSERGGTARLERRDPRTETGAAVLNIAFDRDGHIESSWISALGREVDVNAADPLNTILEWIREPVPTPKLSFAQRAALIAALDGQDTYWVRPNTIQSLVDRKLVRWCENNQYANGGSYITTAAGSDLALALVANERRSKEAHP